MLRNWTLRNYRGAKVQTCQCIFNKRATATFTVNLIHVMNDRKIRHSRQMFYPHLHTLVSGTRGDHARIRLTSFIQKAKQKRLRVTDSSSYWHKVIIPAQVLRRQIRLAIAAHRHRQVSPVSPTSAPDLTHRLFRTGERYSKVEKPDQFQK